MLKKVLWSVLIILILLVAGVIVYYYLFVGESDTVGFAQPRNIPQVSDNSVDDISSQKEPQPTDDNVPLDTNDEAPDIVNTEPLTDNLVTPPPAPEKPIPQNNTKPATPEKIVWDGVYKMSGTLKCTGSIPNLSSLPLSEPITVKGNQVKSADGNLHPIDAQGKSVFIIDQTVDYQGNKVKVHSQNTYQFTQSGNKASAVLTPVATLSVYFFKSTCTGLMSGERQ